MDLDDVVVQEQLSRNLHFFGREAMARLVGCRVAVIGLGGVGSHAAHLLLRSGIGSLLLVDFDQVRAFFAPSRLIWSDVAALHPHNDRRERCASRPSDQVGRTAVVHRAGSHGSACAAQVTVSSLNRHATATRADVGLPKATALARHFATIAPEATVDARVAMFSAETEDAILGGDHPPDYVLDAIDNLETKVRLRRVRCVVTCGRARNAGQKRRPPRAGAPRCGMQAPRHPRPLHRRRRRQGRPHQVRAPPTTPRGAVTGCLVQRGHG